MLGVSLFAGPVEFGIAELNKALTARGLRLKIRAEISQDAPESYRIEAYRVTGGDLRGLMYGLLEAADQIRSKGRLVMAKGSAATPFRGVRMVMQEGDLGKGQDQESWRALFEMLARNRFNNFRLVLAMPGTSPYPYLVTVPEFPEVSVAGVTAEQRERNLRILQFLARSANDYAIDFTLGIRDDGGAAGELMGLAPENLGPYEYAALKKLLAVCGFIRSVNVKTIVDRPAAFYRDSVVRAIREAGRRVTLELNAGAIPPGLMDAAKEAGVPLRISANYSGEAIGRPYQPGEMRSAGSYLNLLEKPHACDVRWEVRADGAHLWGDPEFVRRAVPTLALSGSRGFEIDGPPPQRFWLFYLLWGRLSYDLKTPDRVWLAELERRFGKAAADVLEAYRQSSRAMNEMAAAETGDGRFFASAEEAARNRSEGYASAKQTPDRTAELLNTAALLAEQALDRARAKIIGFNQEWLSAESDFRAVVKLARERARTLAEGSGPVGKWSARPTITHHSPASAVPDKPLTITVRISPTKDVRAIRLHYRNVNQLESFKTLESSSGAFTIPASDISRRWDLLYYFEVVNKDNTGWFEPNPLVATPYYVVKTEEPPVIEAPPVVKH